MERPMEYATRGRARPAQVARDFYESRIASKRFGGVCVRRDGVTGRWRAVPQSMQERERYLRTLEAEVRLTPMQEAAARRERRLADIALDLEVERLRAWRRAQEIRRA
jgi:hypothetical protein